MTARTHAPMNVIGWWAVTVPADTPPSAIATINKWFVERREHGRDQEVSQ
jgi:hypothetical protein